MFKGTSLENTCLEKRTEPRKITEKTETKISLQTDCKVFYTTPSMRYYKFNNFIFF